MTFERGPLVDATERAVERTASYLFDVQRQDGSWRDTISASAVSTGVALMALHHAGRERFAPLLEEGCAWLRETQQPDGSWGDAVVDVGSLNATAIALPVLRLVDPRRSRATIDRATAYLDASGGIAAVSDRTRCSLFKICLTFMAMAGLSDWSSLERMPLEMVLVPHRLWQKFSVTMPGVFAWGLMHDRRLRLSPLVRALNRLVEPRVLAWLERSQGADGSYEESPLLTAIVHIGLHLAGAGQAVADRCLEFLLSTRRDDGSWAIERDLECSVTSYVLTGMEAAGLGRDARLRSTARWLLDAQQAEPFEFTGCPEGGWTWGLPAGWPDADDTAGALTALLGVGVPPEDPRLRRGFRWLREMQNRDGSWSMFVRNSDVSMDRPCPGVTARAASVLARSSGGAGHPAVARAVGFLRRVQRADGAVHSIWFRSPVYGTAAALDAFVTLSGPHDRSAVACTAWLLASQGPDGSWGGGDRGPGTVEETAWAVAALLAGGAAPPPVRPHVDRAVAWLLRRQRPDGSWPAGVVGLYFLSLWYSSDHVANGFALRALARHCRQGSVPAP